MERLYLIELFFTQKFASAEDWADSTIQLSTDEIREAIVRHTGHEELTNEDIYNFMEERDYRYDSLDGLNIKWLLVERK